MWLGDLDWIIHFHGCKVVVCVNRIIRIFRRRWAGMEKRTGGLCIVINSLSRGGCGDSPATGGNWRRW